MELNKSINFKSNVADLSKIPPYEFEKYFQEWMERDDVARSLQAKLRCDLIMNFNKTNLGKQILSHTASSSGVSKMRLILSPLVLALNSLVAEFLYAQNCHFTLSVFCTEIPFRNTLPDFEGMRKFRFNNEEIFEIWQAVTGSKAFKTELNKNVIENYENNPNTSLLLLIVKNLAKKSDIDHIKRNAEVQTEIKEKSHKSISAQISDQDKPSVSKTTPKVDNFKFLNKYLLTLSEKVIEMTKEFEEFSKQKRESRSRTLQTSRSREYNALSKSLERITANMKEMAQEKRKSKRLSNIIESIDKLTQQFSKCAQNFDSIIKVLLSKDNEKPKRDKVKYKDKKTETDLQEKSYNDWIHEMRNTENGQKFLNRVDICLRKALAKQQQLLHNETEVKMKHFKSLMRLHYQQKLSKHLWKDPELKLEETRKCNENIKFKLQQFEEKQTELLEKLQESSLDLNKVQPQEEIGDFTKEEEKKSEKEDETCLENSATKVDTENAAKHDLKYYDLGESQKDSLGDHIVNEKVEKFSLKDVARTQEQIMDIAQTIADQGRSVDRIIYDAKFNLFRDEFFKVQKTLI